MTAQDLVPDWLNLEVFDRVSPGTGRRYVVAYCTNHKTLSLGDLVVVNETPDHDNVLVRLTDGTIHEGATVGGYSVVLAPLIEEQS